jgi:uncharacterized protein YodC (DUF2158 family)
MKDAEKGGVAVGDVVRLKSGGPDMTVSEFDGTTAVCEWQNLKGVPMRRRYAPALLQKLIRVKKTWVPDPKHSP